jgi:hypothetical protein
MPIGIYKRTEKHLEQCSRAGKISAAKKRELRKCKGCETMLDLGKKSRKKFCSKKCFDKYQTKPINEVTNYGLIHKRIRRWFGTPNECENCGDTTSTKFEWANISGEYQLERSDWARLCCKCHRRYDFGVKNRIDLSL